MIFLKNNIIRPHSATDKKRRHWAFTLLAAVTTLSLALAPSSVAAQSSQGKSAKTVQITDVVKAAQSKYGQPKEAVLVKNPAGVKGLKELIDLQLKPFPGAPRPEYAELTSTFYDYRTVSIYRRNPGLHLGYDIAMPAGTAVKAGWPGTVVSIAPWADNEWGVTVAFPKGGEVTYGHIRPALRLGDPVSTGTVVGHVSINHVDVKMRDASGNYVPFGESEKDALKIPAGGGYTRVVPVSTKEQLMVGWLTERNSLETSQLEYEARQREQKLAQIERRRLEGRYSSLQESVPQLEQYCQEGLVSRVEAENARQDLTKTRQELSGLKKRQAKLPEQLSKLQKQIESCRKREKQAAAKAQARGISWQDVDNFVQQLVAKDAKLSKKVSQQKKMRDSKAEARLKELRQEAEEHRKNLKGLRQLYEMGGLPRNELEAEEKKLKYCEDQIKTLEGA